MDFVFSFCVADRHDGCTQKARRIEALFAVVITVIVHGEGRPVEDLLGIGEIKAVFFQVGSTLDRIPRKEMFMRTANSACVNPWAVRAVMRVSANSNSGRNAS